MFDAWMSAWERIAKAAPHPMGLPRTAYPKPQDWLPVVQPAMVPAAAGMAAWNAGTASWVGLWMGFARAPLAAYETLAGSAVAAPVAKSAPAVVARTAAPKAATPKQAKPKAVSAPAKAAAATAKPKAATKAKAAAKA
ncbi:MAG: hypothetical protein KI785_12165, partial [Devosiaceae bacterium]|nr:hypothetical protein [Devosiaceae bacterium MH13]